jgi:hypothetical protein
MTFQFTMSLARRYKKCKLTFDYEIGWEAATRKADKNMKDSITFRRISHGWPRTVSNYNYGISCAGTLDSATIGLVRGIAPFVN